MPLPPLRLLVRCPRLADWERMYRDWTRKVNPGFEEWLVRGEIQGVFRKWASDVLYLQSWAFFRFLAERTNTRTSLAAFMKAALRAPPEADHWDVAFGREFGIRADEDWRALQRRFDRFLRDGG